MPASSPPDTHDADAAIRATVTRLCRPDGDGGAVIERAAIVAEGAQGAEIERWILSHGGEPEAPVAAAGTPGLYGSRPGAPASTRARPPRRYVLPKGALA
jgi:hypothetical protein